MGKDTGAQQLVHVYGARFYPFPGTGRAHLQANTNLCGRRGAVENTFGETAEVHALDVTRSARRSKRRC